MADSQQLALTNVVVQYPGTSAPQLTIPSVTAQVGQLIGIIGASRSGKTTLCRVLAGIIPNIVHGKLTGIVQLGSYQPVTDWAAYRQHLGVVFQDSAGQLSGLSETVADELAFDLVNQGQSEATIVTRVHEIAQQLGLTSQLSQAPTELSGGQLQRLAIGCALITHPQVLVMDDPTSQMDPQGRAAFFKWLRQLADTTVLVVSDEIDDLCEIADQLWGLADGELVISGTPRQVINQLVPEWHLPVPVTTQLAQTMNWRLADQSWPVTLTELKEASYDHVAAT